MQPVGTGYADYSGDKEYPLAFGVAPLYSNSATLIWFGSMLKAQLIDWGACSPFVLLGPPGMQLLSNARRGLTLNFVTPWESAKMISHCS
jgi:hypothetical protein